MQCITLCGFGIHRFAGRARGRTDLRDLNRKFMRIDGKGILYRRVSDYGQCVRGHRFKGH